MTTNLLVVLGSQGEHAKVPSYITWQTDWRGL